MFISSSLLKRISFGNLSGPALRHSSCCIKQYLTLNP